MGIIEEALLNAKVREVAAMFSANQLRMMQKQREVFLNDLKIKIEPIAGKVWEHDPARNSQDAMRRIFSYSHVQMKILPKFVFISLLSYCK